MARAFLVLSSVLGLAILASGDVPECRADPAHSSQQSVYQRAESLLAAQHVTEAEALMQSVLTRNPDDPRALLLMGKIHAGQGRDLEAQQAFERVLSLQPASTDAHLQLGLIQLKLGLNQDALASFEGVLQAAPTNTQAREGEVRAAVALALSARKSGDQDGALVYLVRARKWVPDDPSLLVDFGIQAESLRLYKDAEDALKQSLAIRPNDPSTTYALARVEVDEQKTVEAERDLRTYLAAKPSDASAHYGLGKLLHMLTRNEEARAELQRSIELQPAQTESYYELGQIDLEAQNDSQAALWFGKASSTQPEPSGRTHGNGDHQLSCQGVCSGRDISKVRCALCAGVWNRSSLLRNGAGATGEEGTSRDGAIDCDPDRTTACERAQRLRAPDYRAATRSMRPELKDRKATAADLQRVCPRSA